MTPKIAKALTIMLLCMSLAYLTVEVAFTSYLIEFLGSTRTNAEILDIEHTGRLLTGTALALFVFGWIIPTALKRFGMSPEVLLTLALIILPASYYLSYRFVAWGIEELVITLTDQTDAVERRDAMLVTAVVGRLHMLENNAPVLNFSQKYVPALLTQTTRGRIVLAGLPFLLSSVPHLEDRFMQVLERSFHKGVRARLGSDEKAYNDLYVRPMREIMAPTFDGYVTAVNRYRQARYDSVHEADIELDEYQEELARYHLTMESANKYPRIRKAVAEKLVKRNWRFQAICDRKGLPTGVADFDEVIGSTISDEFGAAIAKLGLGELSAPVGTVSFKNFLNFPEVKALWQEKIKSMVSDTDLADRLARFGPRYGTSPALLNQFSQEVVAPYETKMVADMMADLQKDVTSYLGTDNVSQRAYSAMKAVIVIPIAIFFSMVGAIAHMSKVGYLTLSVFNVPRMISLSVIACVLFGVLSITAGAQSDELNSWKPSKVFFTSVEARYGSGWKTVMATTITVQSNLYPIGLWIRQQTGIFKLDANG